MSTSRPSSVAGQGIDVPSYFLCPISLQIMRDPVTLPTGITYDRDGIEKWISSKKERPSCPVTMQPLADAELTPNHTLRRLIQAWCVVHASHGVERFPTPRPPLDKEQIAKLLLEGARGMQSQLTTLRKLRRIVDESERNRRCAEAAGVPDFLVSVIRVSSHALSSYDEESATGGCVEETTSRASACAREEALRVLHSLQISSRGFFELMLRNRDLVELLTAALKGGNYQSRAYATFLLRSIFEELAPVNLLSLKEDLFEELVNVVRDRISYKVTKEALQALARLCPWWSNRIKAAEAGGVPVLVELLLDDPQKSICEMALVVLEQLCACAEGRAELLGHPAGLSLVSKKMLKVSPLATERAVRVLHSVSRFSATPAVLQEMMQVGIVSKLCLLLPQVDLGSRTREKAKDILRLHWGTWKIPHASLHSCWLRIPFTAHSDDPIVGKRDLTSFRREKSCWIYEEGRSTQPCI